MSAGTPTPRDATAIALEHGSWRTLHEASRAWNDLLTYTQALEGEADSLRAERDEGAQMFHTVMALLANTKMKHGKCQPRADRACTHCNAVDALDGLLSAYGGPPLAAAEAQLAMRAGKNG